MHRRVDAPRGLRRRLTLTFVLVAGLATGALALGSFLLVRQTRIDAFTERALAQARSNLAIADDNLPPQPNPPAVRRLLALYGTGSFETVALASDRAYTSGIGLGPTAVPPALRSLVGRRALAYQREAVGERAYLIVGAPAPGPNIQLYFFFSEERLRADLAQLGRVLAAGWLALTIFAGLVGSFVARRTLGPVAEASRAARSLAEGLLDTRLPSSGDEFGAWAASFNQMANALESKIRELSEARDRERRFTSDVAHELRTPLAALVSEASLLRERLDELPPDVRRPAELLVNDVARLRRLVEDLMEISRLDAGRESIRREPVDVGALIATMLRTRGWDAKVALRADTVIVDTDRRRLERIVSNLVGNALEHGGRDVGVRVASDAVAALVEVSDTGVGIRREDLAHVFDRFYKADPSRTGPGAGLGLSIALENARLLGGEIEVWSEPGSGTRFTLRLPVPQPLQSGEGGVAGVAESSANTRTKGGTR